MRTAATSTRIQKLEFQNRSSSFPTLFVDCFTLLSFRKSVKEIMNSLIEPDYTHIQFQYEVLGMTCQEIATANPPMNEFAIRQMVETFSWSEPAASNELAVQTHTLASMSPEEAAEELLQQAKAELTKASVVKQLALFNRFASAESQILSKLSQAISQVDPMDTKTLKSLVGALQALSQQNPLMTVKAATEEGEDGRVVVQIMNQVSSE